MRIAQVVTYLTPDNRFGGPVAVAREQSQELIRLGHEVDIFAARSAGIINGFEETRDRTSRGISFKRLTLVFAPLLLLKFLFTVRRYAVIHVHLGRDTVSLPIAAIAITFRRKTIVQTHGMIAPDPRVASRLLDSLATRWVLKRATVLALTEAESLKLEEVAGCRLRVRILPNAVSARQPSSSRANPQDSPIVFIGRLHPRKRVDLFVEVARLLHDDCFQPTLRFEIYGPDEGDLRTVLDAAETVENLRYGGALPPHLVRECLRGARALVLPSEGEVFPMVVVEALAEGTPVLLASDCEMTEKLVSYSACIPIERDHLDIVTQLKQLLSEPQIEKDLAAGAKRAVDDWLSIHSVGQQLLRTYSEPSAKICHKWSYRRNKT